MRFAYNKISGAWVVTQKGLDGIVATRICTCENEDSAREVARQLNAFPELVAALARRMTLCCCHFGGLNPDGFADQPCPECDRDRALLAKLKE